MRFPCAAIFIHRPRQSYIRRRSTVCTNCTNASRISPPSHLARLHGGPKYICLSHSYKYTRRWLAPPRTFPKRESINGTSPNGSIAKSVLRISYHFMKFTRSKIEEEKVLQIFLFFFSPDTSKSHRDVEVITKKEKKYCLVNIRVYY